MVNKLGGEKVEVPSKDAKFLREYFIQTRKEIDTEKRERDKMLHFAIILLGGVLLFIVQSEKLLRFSHPLEATLFELSLLIIISSMFWIRWKKMCQISDRWYVLFGILENYLGKERSKIFLEKTVLNGFKTRRYVCKDAWLNLALCLPIYLVMIKTSFRDFDNLFNVMHGFIIALAHGIISFKILSRPMKKPGNLPDFDD